MAPRVRGVYGTPWSKLAGGFKISKKTLEKLGACLVKTLAAEAKKDFAKRGWSGKDPMGGPPIWDSFSYRIRGKSTVEILSSFYGLEELTTEGVTPRRMTWLSQEKKDASPNTYKRTEGEKRRKMKRGGRVSKGERLPLVVPVKTQGGTVVFRTAPIKTNQAWIHPGIAKFTFMQRAVKKGREQCAQIIAEEIVEQLAQGDSTR
jgi:hypothetical protein